MNRARRVRIAGLAAVAVTSVLVVLSACSNQGEGDRCNFDNGNDDCQDGLVCIPATAQAGRGGGLGTVNPPYNTSDRCCPQDRSTATHPACTLPTSSLDAAPAGPTPTLDGASDSATDAADAADAAEAGDAAEGG